MQVDQSYGVGQAQAPVDCQRCNDEGVYSIHHSTRYGYCKCEAGKVAEKFGSWKVEEYHADMANRS